MKNNFLISCYALSIYSNSLLHIPEYYASYTLKFVVSWWWRAGWQQGRAAGAGEDETGGSQAVWHGEEGEVQKTGGRKRTGEYLVTYLDLSNEKLCFLNTHIL